MFREQRKTIESEGVGVRTREGVQLQEKHKEVAGVRFAHRRGDLFV